mmetsp:Transcript_19909/g.35522  ORF Transcript_19909/g.35522 Transcript_19909/m.35522 type:complete len:367 (+) Transcript_19909:107-1207(+)|eukprot:CAMPEP_0197542552 /NCGR_PEP_ID=MMETSP1318-20131121/67765_1 /TAXON_ID=552666 /ORGANISM="Partenskyella glossopodia, Strain RCC365" /LENGTH=366 /DNA_ID=CAMNT_0043101823 /DNA_START=86 /DNA_END=1186 /DNA_ORIENTATION=+
MSSKSPRSGAGSPTARRRLSVVTGKGKGKGNIFADQDKIDGFGDERKSMVDGKKITEKNNIQKTNDGVIERYCSFSRVGYVPFNNSKVNQDRYLEQMKFANEDSKHLFGVFDGHGVNGHDVSQFLIDILPNAIAGKKNLDSEPEAAITKAFIEVNEKLDRSGIDVTCSGTTAVVCYIKGTSILTCNSGDSRAVIGQLEEGKLIALPLSIDQKPELESERKRIVKSGGRVQACQDLDGRPIGPMRVWLKHQDIPGLAMTRSFGDKLAASVGVTCEPEILKFDIELGKTQFIVLGSDGIWEFISNSEAVDMVAEAATPQEAVSELVNEATRRWQAEEEVIDDITATVVYLKESKYPINYVKKNKSGKK